MQMEQPIICSYISVVCFVPLVFREDTPAFNQALCSYMVLHIPRLDLNSLAHFIDNLAKSRFYNHEVFTAVEQRMLLLPPLKQQLRLQQQRHRQLEAQQQGAQKQHEQQQQEQQQQQESGEGKHDVMSQQQQQQQLMLPQSPEFAAPAAAVPCSPATAKTLVAMVSNFSKLSHSSVPFLEAVGDVLVGSGMMDKLHPSEVSQSGGQGLYLG